MGEKLVTNQVYTVRYDRKKYKAELILLGKFYFKKRKAIHVLNTFNWLWSLFLGTQKDCDDKVDSLCTYEVNPSLKKKITKGTKRQYDEIIKEKYSIELKIVKSENETLKRRIAELESRFIIAEDALEDCKKENHNLKEQLEKTNSSTSKQYIVL